MRSVRVPGKDEGFEERLEGFELGRGHFRLFAQIVVAADPDGAIVVGIRFKIAGLRRRHGAALKLQALPRSRRKRRLVARFLPAKITLGRRVQPDWCDDLRTEPRGEPVGANVFVSGVHSAVRDILTEVVKQVTEIVQQARSNDLGRLAPLPREGGALERVLEFGDLFAVVAMPAFAEHGEDGFDDFPGSHERDRFDGVDGGQELCFDNGSDGDPGP